MDELMFRKRLIEAVLKLLRTDAELQGDARLPGAIAEYERQLAEVERRMQKPPDVVVGLKTARLFGKVG